MVLEGSPASDLDARAVLQLFGRVVVAPSSPFFLGADKGSNNTGELSAVVEALLWVNEVGVCVCVCVGVCVCVCSQCVCTS